MVLVVVGSFVGGFFFTRFGGPAVSGLNIMSIVAATVGAIVVLVICHLIAGRRAI
ncbi:MAG TPA: GlsB/YeaQ/YmgE family stress response membrane protein [Phenylobacterium sp.]